MEVPYYVSNWVIKHSISGSQLARDRLRGAGVPGRGGGRRVHATGDEGEAVCPGLLIGNRERQ
eukprot:3402707-Rhodomonas_salina.1